MFQIQRKGRKVVAIRIVEGGRVDVVPPLHPFVDFFWSSVNQLIEMQIWSMMDSLVMSFDMYA